MREVAIIGVGQSQFGKFPDRIVPELGREAVAEAMKDAGINAKDIQAAYASNIYFDFTLAQVTLKDLGIADIEMINVDNACAGGATAVRCLWKDIAYGVCDMGVAFGAESMTTSPIAGKLIPPTKGDIDGMVGLNMPAYFAMLGRRIMETQGATIEDFAQLSVKAHDAGMLNPRAQYQKKFTVEEVVNSRMIADPITLLQCCPNTDGAAAVIMCSMDVARRYTTKPVKVAASVLNSADYFYKKTDLISFRMGKKAADQAYEMASIGPEDLDLVELHDAFACEEIAHYEDIGLCPPGGGTELLRSGATAVGGRIPVNPSGGLLSLGHPLGASGVRVVGEVVLHLRGQAGKRQTPGAKVGLAQMLGGMANGLEAGAVGIHILTI